jgi:N-dimethylarginine dimethylaminohydrolase
MKVRTLTKERKPFKIIDADGYNVQSYYDAPYSQTEHDEMALLKTLPWFESGKPLKNWILHETDFYDEVDKIWSKKWGGEGLGKLREVLVSRPTENEIRKEYTMEPQYYYSMAPPGETASMSILLDQYDNLYKILKENGVRVNYVEPPVPMIGAYGYIKNLVTLAGGGLIVKGGAIIHRMGLGSWQRGREVIWSKALTTLGVPIYLTIHGKGIGEPGAGRWLDGKRFVFNSSVVANPEGLRQIKFILDNLGLELITQYSPGWVNLLDGGNIGTTHSDMNLLTADLGLAVIAPYFFDYDFIRYLAKYKVKMIDVPLEEYWGLTCNGITLEAGKVIVNKGAPKTIAALRREGVDVIEIDFTESTKFGISGIHCAVAELMRDQPSPTLEELMK